MSSGSIEKKEKEIVSIEVKNEGSFAYMLSEIIIPFSEFLERKRSLYIYSGNESIPFNQRHPIYKSLMKIEFENVIRDFKKNRIKSKNF